MSGLPDEDFEIHVMSVEQFEALLHDGRPAPSRLPGGMLGLAGRDPDYWGVPG